MKKKRQYAVDTVACHPKSLKYSLSDCLKKKVSDPVLDDSRPKYHGAGTCPPYCALFQMPEPHSQRITK